MKPLRFSYFQLTFGQDETYLHPEQLDPDLPQRVRRRVTVLSCV